MWKGVFISHKNLWNGLWVLPNYFICAAYVLTTFMGDGTQINVVLFQLCMCTPALNSSHAGLTIKGLWHEY